MRLPCNKILEILEDVQTRTSWKNWLKKDTLLFNLEAKYGSCFDRDRANSVYDMITRRVVEERLAREKENK